MTITDEMEQTRQIQLSFYNNALIHIYLRLDLDYIDKASNDAERPYLQNGDRQYTARCPERLSSNLFINQSELKIQRLIYFRTVGSEKLRTNYG